MVTLFEKLTASHRQRLEWFDEHSGDVITWPEPIQDGGRLASKAKGIYKPQDLTYALSIRLSFDGPYDDGDIDYRGDDTWSLVYSQEEPAKHDPSQYFTNKGLAKCIQEQVPVGVYRKLDEPGGGVRRYEIVGLALPIRWENGFFTLEGPVSLERFASTGAIGPDVKSDDARRRVLREIAARQGQPLFRRRLVDVYQSRCVLSGCSTVEALEAAHIRPYRGPLSNTPTNGILLRADLHTLFDLRLFGIQPHDRKVHVSSRLKASEYAELEGKRLAEPRSSQVRPTESVLAAAWTDFLSSSP